MIRKLPKSRSTFLLTITAGAMLNVWAIVVAMAVPNRGFIGFILNLTPYLAYWPNLLVGRNEDEWFDPDFGFSILVNVVGWLLLGCLMSWIIRSETKG